MIRTRSSKTLLSLSLWTLCSCSHQRGEVSVTPRPSSKADAKTSPSAAPPLQEKFAAFFPFDSAEPQASTQERLDAKCRQIGAYTAASGDTPRGARLYVASAGHADVREKDAPNLAIRRRKAIESALSRCAPAQTVDLCAEDLDPRSEGEASWHRVRFFKTALRREDRSPMDTGPQSSKELKKSNNLPEVQVDFLHDSDELRPDTASAWAEGKGPCQELKGLLANWHRGLFVAGYASSAEVDAATLPARRAAAALRLLTGTCRLDAAQLFTVPMPITPEPEPASHRRRVDLEVGIKVEPGGSNPWQCPHVRRPPILVLGDRLTVMPTLRFGKGSSALRPQDVAELDAVCASMKGGESVLQIRGFAAPDEPANGQLPQQRADAVQRQLLSCGVDPDRMRIPDREAASPASRRGGGVELNIIP